MGGFSITRQIGIDMGHRVPTHGSKCWNLHGHRYEILATASTDGDLQSSGEQTDMVLDFSFLKAAMMQHIDAWCDHGMILWDQDPLLPRFLGENYHIKNCDYFQVKFAGTFGFFQEDREKGITKTLLVPFIPTAERLAEFWFKLMQEDVFKLSDGCAKLTQIQVFETPNGNAIYPMDQSEALSYRGET